MRIAALYDIHGNLPALEAVLDEVHRAGVETVVVGGDVVVGPMTRGSIDRLLALEVPVHFIRGNAEVAVLTEMAGRDSGLPPAFRELVQWEARELRDRKALLAGWPMTLRITTSCGDTLFCHATPRDENEIFTRLTPDAALVPIFDEAAAALVVCGHTHMQFDRTIGTTRVVNAGSVGMPFGEPGAYWLFMDDEQVALRRTSYDLPAAAERIRQSPYPQALEFANSNVLQPPAEASILEMFASVALK